MRHRIVAHRAAVAAAMAIKGMTDKSSMEDLAKAADAFYTESGGTSDMQKSREWVYRPALPGVGGPAGLFHCPSVVAGVPIAPLASTCSAM